MTVARACEEEFGCCVIGEDSAQKIRVVSVHVIKVVQGIGGVRTSVIPPRSAHTKSIVVLAAQVIGKAVGSICVLALELARIDADGSGDNDSVGF